MLHYHKKGSVLAFSLIVLSFLLMSAVSLATISTISRKSSIVGKNSNVAFQSVDSAIEVMIQKIYTATNLNDIDTPIHLAGQIGASCSGNTISGTVADASYKATLYDVNGTAISCSDPNWQDAARKVVFVNSYKGNDRAVEINIAPTCNQLIYDGDTYPVSVFKMSDTVSHCWMTKDLAFIGGGFSLGTDYKKNDAYSNVSTDPVLGGTGQSFPEQILYEWNTVMNGQPATSTTRTQGICPPGWYIPLQQDFQDLETTETGMFEPSPLRSTLWYNWHPFAFEKNDEETSKFQSLPAGYYDSYNTKPEGRGDLVQYWTSEKDAVGNPIIFKISTNPTLSQSYIPRDHNYFSSVRCIKY